MSEDWNDCRKLSAYELAELKRLNPCNSEILLQKLAELGMIDETETSGASPAAKPLETKLNAKYESKESPTVRRCLQRR